MNQPEILQCVSRLRKVISSEQVQDGLKNAEPGQTVGIVVYEFEVQALTRIAEAACKLASCSSECESDERLMAEAELVSAVRRPLRPLILEAACPEKA